MDIESYMDKQNLTENQKFRLMELYKKGKASFNDVSLTLRDESDAIVKPGVTTILFNYINEKKTEQSKEPIIVRGSFLPFLEDEYLDNKDDLMNEDPLVKRVKEMSHEAESLVDPNQKQILLLKIKALVRGDLDKTEKFLDNLLTKYPNL